MVSSSFDDPETSYRRGYVQGVHELFQALAGWLPVKERGIVKTWLEDDLGEWRLQIQRGETGRAADGSINRPPPKLALPRLNLIDP